MEVYYPPKAYAQMLLKELNITQVPTPVEDICTRINIRCDHTTEIDSGALIVKGGKLKRPVIAVKVNSEYESRTRFSIAHELGHFYIPSHLDDIYQCSATDLNTFDFINKKDYKAAEKEANEFAAELLMPSSYVEKAIKHHDVSLQVIKKIAEDCDTSLTSTALQVTNLCSDRIAVVFSQAGSVRWFKKTDAFNLFLDCERLSRESIASQLYQPNSLVSEKGGEVPIEAWSNDDCRYEYLLEESLFMPYLNSTLTILTIPYDEFNEGDEEVF